MTEKLKISKSAIMQRAWNIFRDKSWGVRYNTFSKCLIRSWEIERANIKYAEEQMKLIEWYQSEEYKRLCNTPVVIDPIAVSKFYDEAPRGTYFGD